MGDLIIRVFCQQIANYLASVSTKMFICWRLAGVFNRPQTADEGRKCAPGEEATTGWQPQKMRMKGGGGSEEPDN